MRRNSHIIILGGGAAGLMAAITAARRGRDVTVVERQNGIGKKILISGGGRCNFTNLKVSYANFVSDNPDFPRSALARFQPKDFMALVEKHGVAYHEKKLGQLFCDVSARAITDLLAKECAETGVTIVTGVTVREVDREQGRFIARTSQGDYTADKLVVATGGLTLPKMATDLGYRIARQFGINVTATAPALAPLLWDESRARTFGALSGISLEVEAACRQARFRENLLFTHKGLSGPAILQISSYWRAGATVRVNLMPEKNAGDELLRRKKESQGVTLKNALTRYYPDHFAQVWGENFYPSRRLNHIADAELRRIGDKINNWEFIPSGTEGFTTAEVTRGGVSTAELSSKTMESRHVPGLYFIGEVVDVTGWLGGYNFQWAWASGYAAGMAA